MHYLDFIPFICRTDKHLGEVNSPSTHLQNFPGDSLTSISLTGSVSGPRMSTGLGEVHSTFWTRWYARLTQSDAENRQISQTFVWQTFSRCRLDACRYYYSKTSEPLFSPSRKGMESVLMASRATISLLSLELLRLCFCFLLKKDLRAAAERVLLESSFISVTLCLR